jgi:hypothetical protein
MLAQHRDPAVAVAPSGDIAVARENLLDNPQLRVRGVQDDMVGNAFEIAPGPGTPDAASLGLGDGGLVAAWRLQTNQRTDVYVGRWPAFPAEDGPPALQISEHAAGVATAPTVALHPDGSFVVAWGEPDGAIVYRRFALPDLEPGPKVSTGVHVGGGTNNNATPWAGAAVRPSDAAVVVVGRDLAGHLVLQRFDADDAVQDTVQVSDVDARWTPFVDVASDPWGNLVVAWSECGAPDDLKPHCGDLPSTSQVRWFFADREARPSPSPPRPACLTRCPSPSPPPARPPSPGSRATRSS